MKILFVCLGNICRSPMAELIFRDMVKKAGLEDSIQCASAAVLSSEAGNSVYPPAQAQLRALGIDPRGKVSIPLRREDYGRHDLLLGMEKSNIAAMKRICGGDPEGKIRRLLDDTPHPRDIADPYYTLDFDTACRDIQEGCRSLLEKLKKQI